MRVLFLTHYFHPEGNAPGTRVYELCRRWVAMGHAVTVITGVPNVPNGVAYEGYENKWFQRERVDGIETIRVWTYLAPNKGTARRILNYLSLMLSATVAALYVRKPDLVIATSPQFFCGWAGVWVGRLRRIPFILEVRDLWPESIVAVGAMRAGRWLRLLKWLEKRMYAAATRIVTVGEGYRRCLIEKRVAAERISVVMNGIDREVFERLAPVLRYDAIDVDWIPTLAAGLVLVTNHPFNIVILNARPFGESLEDVVRIVRGAGSASSGASILVLA